MQMTLEMHFLGTTFIILFLSHMLSYLIPIDLWSNLASFWSQITFTMFEQSKICQVHNLGYLRSLQVTWLPSHLEWWTEVGHVTWGQVSKWPGIQDDKQEMGPGMNVISRALSWLSIRWALTISCKLHEMKFTIDAFNKRPTTKPIMHSKLRVASFSILDQL